MSKLNNLTDFLTDVADAIRTKKGTSGTINPQNFSSEIASISGGGISGGYNVTFKSDGSDYTIVSCVAGGSILEPQAPTKSGYAFIGWSSTSGGSVDITFPYTPSGNTDLYAVYTQWSCTVANLGSSSPSSVTFTESGTFPTLEEVTIGGNVFIRFPKMYRKVVSDSSSQITSFTISTGQADSTYHIYPCFLKEDGSTEMDYVLMGKYYSTSTTEMNSISGTRANQTISNGRTNARALGTGYQLMDWQFQKLWQDLLICKMRTVDTNSGGGITTDQLGVEWANAGNWIDGVTQTDGAWAFSYKPSAYVDSATSSTTGYNAGSYSAPTTSDEIQKLGYNSSNEFFNYPSAVVTNSSYNTYYCDSYYYSSGSHPVLSYVGDAGAYNGAFRCLASSSWSGTSGVRLCYRPI